MTRTLYDPVIGERAKLEGKLEGKLEERVDIARNLIDVLDDDTISSKTGLPIDQVRKLRLM